MKGDENCGLFVISKHDREWGGIYDAFLDLDKKHILLSVYWGNADMKNCGTETRYADTQEEARRIAKVWCKSMTMILSRRIKLLGLGVGARR